MLGTLTEMIPKKVSGTRYYALLLPVEKEWFQASKVELYLAVEMRHKGITSGIRIKQDVVYAPLGPLGTHKHSAMVHHSTSYAHRWHRDSTIPDIHHEGMKLENNIKPSAVKSGDDGYAL